MNQTLKQSVEQLVLDYLSTTNFNKNDLSNTDYVAAQQIKEFVENNIPEPTNNSTLDHVLYDILRQEIGQTNWMTVYNLVKSS